jgi:hypothetical protein
MYNKWCYNMRIKIKYKEMTKLYKYNVGRVESDIHVGNDIVCALLKYDPDDRTNRLNQSNPESKNYSLKLNLFGLF